MINVDNYFYELALKSPKNNSKNFIKKYDKKVYKELHKEVKKYWEKLTNKNFTGYHFHNIGTKPEDYFKMELYIPLTHSQHSKITNLGLKKSKKIKQKISKTLAGRKLSKEHKQNISKGTKKIKPASRILIRILHSKGRTKVSLADEFGVCRDTISAIIKEGEKSDE